MVLKLLCVDRHGEANRCTYEAVCTEHTRKKFGCVDTPIVGWVSHTLKE